MGLQLSHLKECRKRHREPKFQVVAYCNGVHQGIGKLQIADGKIVLYQKGVDKLVWPIPCLRRYGSDKPHLFSFESGRRCETGPATYTFEMKNPDVILEKVRLIAEEIKMADEEARRSTGTIHQKAGEWVPPLPPRPGSVPGPARPYQNCDEHGNVLPMVNVEEVFYAQVQINSAASSDKSTPPSGLSGHPDYDVPKSPRSIFQQPPPTELRSSSSSTMTKSPSPASSREDVTGNFSSQTVVHKSCQEPVSYTTIDRAKTEAIANLGARS
ncbi:hypothetical protein RvY_09364 [Ramazzottius varieornatus]|uniref:IRS-type PTB domain-containing protein n=1 Tax=Ramazzottius varieornatus TaxID=947166 RepID=A0A1D1VBJ1_RAMVA|nr:hypothetical protein RvY_09364 [Ramazzottius varieornatus]